MKDILVIHNQSLFDIANEQLGSIERVFELALLNGLAVTDDLYPGQLLLLPDVASNTIEMVNYFLNKKIATYTPYPTDGKLTPTQEGIGYMAIEQDFIVH